MQYVNHTITFFFSFWCQIHQASFALLLHDFQVFATNQLTRSVECKPVLGRELQDLDSDAMAKCQSGDVRSRLADVAFS